MATFKDKFNREWIVSLDGPKIREVRREFSLDLAAFDGSAYERLQDPVTLVDTLWILCRGQAAQKNVNDVQFGEALVGDAIEHATESLLEAITDFFPSRKKELIRTLAAKTKTMTEIGTANAMKFLNDPEAEAKLAEAMTVRMKTEFETLLKKLSTPSDSATSSPAS